MTFEFKRMNMFSVRAALALSILSSIWAAILITNFSLNLVGPEKLGLVFNDMAQRLPHLDMTVDPNLISFEAFVRNGRSYAYFGIFPALLRLPLVLAGDPFFPLSRISCLLALWITTFASIRLTQIVIAGAIQTRISKHIAAAALTGVTFSGPPIYVLASSAIYHEAIFWAAAWTAIFNLIVVRRTFVGQSLRSADFALLALAAGCGLLTRVTCGVTLYAGLALLLSWPIVKVLVIGERSMFFSLCWKLFRASVPALAIAALFVAVQAAVNYGRWGDVLAVAPQQYYQTFDPLHAERVARFQRHGGVELARIPVAALHYAFGIKVDDWFRNFCREHYDSIEGPRICAILCAPWMIVNAAFGLVSTLRRPFRSQLVCPLLISNGIGFLLLLSIFALCARYTFDGWAFLTLSAALGTRYLLDEKVPRMSPNLSRRTGQVAIAAALVGVLVSHATLLRYKITYSGTDPQVRYWLSQQIQPLLCPNAALDKNVKLTDFNPLVTPNCPPLW
jgi:hypothetical protein